MMISWQFLSIKGLATLKISNKLISPTLQVDTQINVVHMIGTNLVHLTTDLMDFKLLIKKDLILLEIPCLVNTLKMRPKL